MLGLDDGGRGWVYISHQRVGLMGGLSGVDTDVSFFFFLL